MSEVTLDSIYKNHERTKQEALNLESQRKSKSMLSARYLNDFLEILEEKTRKGKLLKHHNEKIIVKSGDRLFEFNYDSNKPSGQKIQNLVVKKFPNIDLI